MGEQGTKTWRAVQDVAGEDASFLIFYQPVLPCVIDYEMLEGITVVRAALDEHSER